MWLGRPGTGSWLFRWALIVKKGLWWIEAGGHSKRAETESWGIGEENQDDVDDQKAASSLERQGGGPSMRRQARQERKYESLYRGWARGVHTRILVNKTSCRCFLTWRVLYLTFFKDEKLKNKMTKQESKDWKLGLQCINLGGTTDIQALTHEHGKNARVCSFL